MTAFFSDLSNLTHGANPWRRERPTLRFEMFYDILYDVAKLPIESDGIVTMYTGNQVRALSNVHLILITPLHPFVVFVEIFHLLTILIACATCLSW
ncbi:hypothetical protein [Thiocapsa imhoffii]|uniref:hypothetical protein n=1 Tax=Thiocapsa imhoffii TaxID=382777 RepID=UPI001905BD78|nr:hypothetical protein [Thiocapsa imhoffii]